jgi:hypothetical protein
MNPGSPDWQTDVLSDDVTGQIKGYATATSVNQGNSIGLRISVNPPQQYTIDVYRMGWYCGDGGRLMQHIGPLSGTTQPNCPMDAQTGMIECQWALSYTLAVPTTWTTGIYLAKLTNANGYSNYIVFTVRDDGRLADLLYQQPVLTYQAYNPYPDGNGGKSLYEFNSSEALTGLGTQRAVKVSFDRPYDGDGSGNFAFELYWERYFVTWIESMGYDVSYTTDIDTHVNGARPLSFKGFLSVGHNEYWSKQMYDAIQAARDAGVNLAFFGADPIYWQVRLESSGGVPNRRIACYKDATLDPTADTLLTTILWRDLGRPEQAVVGVQYTTDGDYYSNQPLIIKNSSSWVWSGTNFVDGTAIPGLVGYEVDKLFAEYPAPASQSYTTLADSPYQDCCNPLDKSQSSIYRALSGAWVFAAGTMSWNWALGRDGYVNAGIQRATKNILDAFGATSSVAVEENGVTRAEGVRADPNPSVAEVTLRFRLAAQASAHLEIYDVGGRRVRSLHAGVMGPGLHTATWDGHDDSGHAVGAGVFFARLVVAGQVSSARILRLH